MIVCDHPQPAASFEAVSLPKPDILAPEDLFEKGYPCASQQDAA
jgi:hypothetical protein